MKSTAFKAILARRINTRECKDYENTFARMESDCTLRFGFLVDLLSVATKGQLFQFNVALYEHTDGVAMGSPLGPLLANVFMSHVED